MDIIFQDLRFSLRMLLKNIGFTLVAVTAIALGIGANTAIFSVVNSVLLRPLPYPSPDRLMTLWQDYRGRGGPEREWGSLANLVDWREQSRSFEGMAAVIGWGPTYTGGSEPEQLSGAAINYDTFSVLGVEPALGRSFLPEEDKLGAERVVVLSHGLWQRRFGGDPAMVGKTISLSGESSTVIGIMPAGFQLPFIGASEIWVPLRQVLGAGCANGRACLVLRIVGRLKPGVPVEQAETEMDTIAARLAEKYPEANAGVSHTIVPLHDFTVGNIRPALLVLLGAVAFVLLIACANVANLLLARASAREKEIAIRSALGAGRARLVRQLLTESLLLSFIGGALGLMLAFWLVDLLVAFAPDGTPRINEIGIDGPMLIFTFAIAMLTGLVFGLIPALQSSRPDLNQSLKENKGANAGSGGRRARSALVVAEVALALVLLIGAGLLIKSFLNLMRVDPGFNPENVLTLNIGLPRVKYPEAQQSVAFYNQLLERIKSLPGVRSAGATTSLPLGLNNTDSTFIIEGRPLPKPGEEPGAWYSSVTTDYFTTMGMSLLRGRVFDERDNMDSALVILINETMAKRYWPDEDPIGKRISDDGSDQPRWREIVGVVRDVKHFGLSSDARPTMFLPFGQTPSRGMYVTVRTASDPMSFVAAVRSQVSGLDKDLAISRIATMDEMVSRSVSQPRFVLLLLGLFAALALVLAAVGIYGVISYSVTQRTHEIGIRVALGAGSSDVLRLVVGQGMMLALSGVGIGLAGALLLTRVMESLLYGVSATDLVTYVVISVILAMVAMVASYIPARRATKVDPMTALRYE